jgi:pimeloyl-ACP methyl ester carboxylesterase
MILHALEAGAGDGPPIVLLHGLFGHAGNFGFVQKHLAAGARVLSLDLRNHGASPHTDAMDYPAMAADVAETLAARGGLPCRLVGHSMGGKVAMRLALERPDAVSHLVVADIAPARNPPHHRAIIAAMLSVRLEPGLTRPGADAVLAPAVSDPQTRAFLLANLRTGPVPRWRLNLPAIAASMPAIEDWPGWSGAPYPGPVLVIAGARSDYIRPDHRPAIRALFPAARIVTLKDAGHWLHADNPAGFIAVLDGFLGA